MKGAGRGKRQGGTVAGGVLRRVRCMCGGGVRAGEPLGGGSFFLKPAVGVVMVFSLCVMPLVAAWGDSGGSGGEEEELCVCHGVKKEHDIKAGDWTKGIGGYVEVEVEGCESRVEQSYIGAWGGAGEDMDLGVWCEGAVRGITVRVYAEDPDVDVCEVPPEDVYAVVRTKEPLVMVVYDDGEEIGREVLGEEGGGMWEGSVCTWGRE